MSEQPVPASAPGAGPPAVTLRDALPVWLRIALLGFGGPAGQVAMMHRTLVVERRWVSERRFMHALNYCMLLPGPEAQQLATYLGWLMHRTWGGLVAGVLFVLPGFVAILALSVLYVGFQDAPLVEAIFFGIRAAVLAVVVDAVLRIGRRALHGRTAFGIAAASFLGIAVLGIPFPLVIIAAGLAGLIASRLRPGSFAAVAEQGDHGHPDDSDARAEAGTAAGDGPAPSASASADAGAGAGRDERSSPAPDGDPALPAIDAALDAAPAPGRPPLGRTLRVIAVWLVLWLAPLAVIALVLGGSSVFTEIGLLLSKLAVVSFGGAYAVLAYLAQEAVQARDWLTPGQMLDGLGMAETTPGPLIQVVQFVAFLAAWGQATAIDPLLAGVLAALLATWVTFMPSFLWIFAGAPYVEYLRSSRALGAMLAAITAAVVGVILSVATWFGLNVAFAEVEVVRQGPVQVQVPVLASLDPASLALTIAALGALLRLRWSAIAVIGASAALGAAWVLLS